MAAPTGIYRALAVSAGALNPLARPDLTNTSPALRIGPHPQWAEPDKIVSLDPWGHIAQEVFARDIAEGIDIRPDDRHHQGAAQPAGDPRRHAAHGGSRPDGGDRCMPPATSR